GVPVAHARTDRRARSLDRVPAAAVFRDGRGGRPLPVLRRRRCRAPGAAWHRAGRRGSHHCNGGEDGGADRSQFRARPCCDGGDGVCDRPYALAVAFGDACHHARQHRACLVGAAMKADGGILVTLAVQFAIMALLALGGANAVVPEMHRLAVEINPWMTEREFSDMFAIAQAAPGPNVMLVTLIGYHIAGFSGALVTTLAMCGPTAVLALFLGRVWDRFKNAPWRMAVQAGVVP